MTVCWANLRAMPEDRPGLLARLHDWLFGLVLVVLRLVAGARQHHHVTGDGVRLRYLRIARPDRPRAVLIHGFSDRPESFLPVARRLRDYDLLLPALPGFHDGLDPDRRYDVRRYAAWVADLLDTLDLRDAHFCGNSLGGAIALVLTTHRPDLVCTLVPLDTGGVELPGVPSIHDEIRAGDNLFLVRRAEEVPAFLSRIFHRPPPTLGPVRHLLAADLRRKADAYSTIMEHLREEGEAHAETGEIVALDAIERPTLVGWGEHDSLFPLAVGKYVAGRIPGACLHVFDGTGHCPHLERPGALARVLLGFWTEHDVRP